MRQLGRTIRILRHEKGWSQEDAAKRLAISVPAFSKIETGITDINLSRLQQIATLFDLSIINLLTYNQPDEAVEVNHIHNLNNRLREADIEMLNLQRKIIQLFEELRIKNIGSGSNSID